MRIGQNESRHRRAIKVWDKREFKDLDDAVEIGTRNIKVALRRLRSFARTGAADELDLDGTIRGTAEKGYLDIRMVPERHNTVKVLMFFDVGGSMDWHIKGAEELFSAARSEFKHLEYYYFHNCLYEQVWKHNVRRRNELIATWDVLHTYPPDYKVIFVGDAAMSPYETDPYRRRRGAHEPGAGRPVAPARDPNLQALRLAQPGGRAALGLYAVDLHDPRRDGGAHVSADLGRARPGDGRADALTGRARK